MELSARMFGVNAWSILVPQALEGVATVAILYATVRRWFTPAAGLLAGAVAALTPVAVLMFRFNNPDALLVLLLTAAAYAVTRALEGASTRWLVLAGSLVGFGFLAKMMQAFLVVPAFALVYLIAAPTPLRRRIVQLLLAGVAMFAAAAWWVAAVALTPASARPVHRRLAAQQHSRTHLRLQRLRPADRQRDRKRDRRWCQPHRRWRSGRQPMGADRLEPAVRCRHGHPGLLADSGCADLHGRCAVAQPTRRCARTNCVQLWCCGVATLLVIGLTISFSKGIIHPYYTVALAPAIGALVGIGATTLWRRREQLTARLFLAAAVAVTAWWSYELLHRTPTFVPWLRGAVLIAGIAVALAILVTRRATRVIAVAIATGAIVTTLAGSAAYAVDTASTPHTGSIPSAGPASGRGPGGFGGGGGGQGGAGLGAPPNGGLANGAPPTGAGPNTGALGGPTGTRPQGRGGAGGGAGGAAGGGLLEGSAPSATLTATLKSDASSYTWVAAAIGSNSASGYQLATGDPVMAIGGFNGSDPSPTLAQFEQYVSAHKIHYFIAGSVGSPNGGSNASSQISQWVASTFTSTTVGGVTLYDLTAPTTSSATSTGNHRDDLTWTPGRARRASGLARPGSPGR